MSHSTHCTAVACCKLEVQQSGGSHILAACSPKHSSRRQHRGRHSPGERPKQRRTCKSQGVVMDAVVQQHDALPVALLAAVHVAALRLHVVRRYLPAVVPAGATPLGTSAPPPPAPHRSIRAPLCTLDSAGRGVIAGVKPDGPPLECRCCTSAIERDEGYHVGKGAPDGNRSRARCSRRS